MRRKMAGLALAVVLGGCNPADDAQAPAAPATPPPAAAVEAPDPSAAFTGFSHVQDENLFGYYLPTQEVRIGDLRLDHLHIGSEMEFVAWEQGERMETYGPVMLQFSDVSSPLVTNELGQETHSRQVRVLPSAYRVGEGDLRFVGSAPEIGEVRLDGQLDLDLLRQAQAAGPSGGEAAPLLRIAAQIGPERLETLSFFWFGGD